MKKYYCEKLIEQLEIKGKQNIVFWGASLFLEEFIQENDLSKYNILGIIDKNSNKWGKEIKGYKIFSPDILKTKPADILVTVYSNSERVHYIVKKELKNQYPKINVLDNIFDSKAGREISEKKYCPFCDEKFWFRPFGIIERKNSLCPNCNSLERHRFLYYIYKLFIPENKKIKILHMAPERAISSMFLNKENIDYICIDLCPENFPHLKNCIKMNVLDLKFPENTFDYIISNHVMEHIEDEETFIKEITRVLKSEGKAIVSVPCFWDQEKTYEDFTITTKEGRLKAFGQEDHVRKYGADIFDRISKYAKVTPLYRKAFEGFIDDKLSLGNGGAVMIIEKFV